MADRRGVLRLPFAKQIAAFRWRLVNLVPTSVWTDLWQAQHDRAFVVAGAVKADLLADLGRAVERAIAEGTGIEAFRRDFRQIVAKHGWHGWTGEGTKAGEAWRTRVIYRTNMATSYAAGRMAQLIEGGFKYWIYRHGGSLEPRVQHLGWDGLVLPPDHPFWQTHAPPNGWGCKCFVTGARSLAGAVGLGGQPEKQLAEGWQMPDPKTGAPAGIDRGWAYAPGAGAAAEIADKAQKLPGPLAQAMFEHRGRMTPTVEQAMEVIRRAGDPAEAEGALRALEEAAAPSDRPLFAVLWELLRAALAEARGA